MKRFWVPLLAIVYLTLGGCDGAAETPTTTPAEMTTTTSEFPLVVFDGETCGYRGPAEVAGGGLISVALENTSDIDIDAAVLAMRSETSLQAAFERIPVGEGSDTNLGFPAGSTRVAWLQASAGGRNQESLLLKEGLYLLDCGHIPSGASTPDHVWRAGSFEVVVEQ